MIVFFVAHINKKHSAVGVVNDIGEINPKYTRDLVISFTNIQTANQFLTFVKNKLSELEYEESVGVWNLPFAQCVQLSQEAYDEFNA